MPRFAPALTAALLATLALPGLAGAQTPAPNGAAEVNQRLQWQQQRTQQGVNSGQLTPGETQRVERNDARIASQEQRMQARDPNGQLTGAQTRRLNAELNRNSRIIKREKHNGRTVAPAG